MKIRRGFVSNSSSSSFTITNKTGTDMTLHDFFVKYEKEIMQWVDKNMSWEKDYYNKAGENAFWDQMLAAAVKLDEEHGKLYFPNGKEIKTSFTNESYEQPTDGFLRHFLDVCPAFEGWEWHCYYNSQADNDYYPDE